MSADQEVELKFLCAPEHLGAVLAAAPAGDDDSRELISVYFDTADRTLQKAGASLRVRESQGRRVQTLKRGAGMSREEYEAPIPGDRPDRALGPLKKLLAREDQLRPAFNVRVTRRQRLIRLGEAEIELALDHGEVSGGRRRSPISEVELELKAGSPRALFDLARTLSAAVPLYLSFEGKAARGQALVNGAATPIRRRGKAVLARRATVAEAFQAEARDALGQIAANAQGVREGGGAEAVHQLRVGARRLRSALSTYKPALAGPGYDRQKTELKWLAKATDQARNLDVFADAMTEESKAIDPGPAGLTPLAEAIQAARVVARQAVADDVSSARFRALMLEAAAWVETGDWLSNPGAAAPAAKFADKALKKRRRKLDARGANLAATDDVGRHHLRIEAKKLRYATEGFESLLPARETRRFLRGLKALQEALGALNDIATAETLIAGLSLSQPAAFAAGDLAGLRAASKPDRIEQAARALAKLPDTPASRH